MKVLLLEDVSGVGNKDDIVDVKDGYGRNYLIPRGLAMEPTSGIVKEVLHRREAREHAEAKEQQVTRELSGRITGSRVTINAKASEEGRLFGAATAKDIAEAIKDQLGLDVDKRRILVGEPLKSLGDHQVDIKLGSGQQATLTVTVQPE